MPVVVAEPSAAPVQSDSGAAGGEPKIVERRNVLGGHAIEAALAQIVAELRGIRTAMDRQGPVPPGTSSAKINEAEVRVAIATLHDDARAQYSLVGLSRAHIAGRFGRPTSIRRNSWKFSADTNNWILVRVC